MVTGLNELRQRRLKWVEANRENNFEEGIKRLLTDLYPDNAHFIYELLQNAEDPRASIARFTLTNDAVEFEHNGERLFDLRDIESITSIGSSTKRDDPTSIGKFGVGFKAVFAYTNTPEVHSGEFRFRIHDLVVPEVDGVKKLKLRDRETRFIFPFNHPTKKPEKAVAEIERALRTLGDNTLLFLAHIRTIEYTLPDGSFGSLQRIDHKGGRIEIRARQPGGDDTVSHWLRFQKEVEVIDEDGTTKNCRIAIAFKLEADEEGRKDQLAWKIVPIEHGQVSIFFPAEKETSNLRFHIHAPFASTVARDSVRDCKSNWILRDRIAALFVDSLENIRDLKMLTVGFLAVLPNPSDSLSPFYAMFRNVAVYAFREHELTPTKSGTHARAVKLFRGPARMSEILNDDDLSLLTNYEPPLWAANPPQQSQREDRFLDSLEVGTWGWSELASALNMLDDDGRKRIENWISQKEDVWLMRFYALLGEAWEVHNEWVDADELRIVRVEAGNGQEHVVPQYAFLLPEQGSSKPAGIGFVKSAVYGAGRSESQKKYAVAFLEHIGVRPFDAKAVIELRLRKYDQAPDEIREEHFEDIEEFIHYWKKSTDAEIFEGHCFLLSQADDNSLDWQEPAHVCLDYPYQSTGLAELKDIHKKHVLSNLYKKKLDKFLLEDFLGFLKSVGVTHEIAVSQTKILEFNPKVKDLWDGIGSVRHTDSKIMEDYTIEWIEKYKKRESIAASRLIWNALIKADGRVAKARYRPNKTYQTRETESQLVQHLKNCAWIPDGSGVFRAPNVMRREDLRTDFPYDDRNGLLTAIGFGELSRKLNDDYRARNDAAKKMGFDSAEDAEKFAKLVKEEGVTAAELRSLFSQRKRASQPEETVQNPERRRKGVLERRDNAPSKVSITRERAIQPGARLEALEAKAYLRAKYKNVDNQLVCQCCHAEMPFKVRGDHYFEAVQCVRGLDSHYFENRLALCPTCAAMYQHARETDDAEIRRSIVENEASETASAVAIPISLAGRQFELRFVGTHWFDIKTVLTG